MDKLLQSHFLALYCMILADGVIEAPELEALYKIGQSQYGLTQEQINQAIKEQGSSFVVPQSFESKIQFLYNLATIALSDGVIDETEIELMKKYVERIGFKKENAHEITDFMFGKVREGMSANDVVELIKTMD